MYECPLKKKKKKLEVGDGRNGGVKLGIRWCLVTVVAAQSAGPV